ncbi:putative signal peptide protein [Puccinia sorghi]|uniref:Putative signal peptide protein n=1 Tax=Puccinia sorghi TaxID=27349 RepID=A0A0L6USF9_9BASI|nr:putative signal peptide protein [Puccinia sorghi]
MIGLNLKICLKLGYSLPCHWSGDEDDPEFHSIFLRCLSISLKGPRHTNNSLKMC